MKKISTLTRITCPTEKKKSAPKFSFPVFHSKGVFMDCYCQPKHSVVLVHSVLKGLWCVWSVNLLRAR